jgi:hypothetical protein
MARGKPTETGILQIRVNNPEIISGFKGYAGAHDLTHGDLFVKIWLAFQASQSPKTQMERPHASTGGFSAEQIE